MAFTDEQKQRAATYRLRLQHLADTQSGLPRERLLSLLARKERKPYTRNPDYHYGDLSKDLVDFREKTSVVTVLRGRLLRFISANQNFLSTPTFLDKAQRSYLKDLTNWDIMEAVKEIMRNKA